MINTKKNIYGVHTIYQSRINEKSKRYIRENDDINT